MFCTIICMTHLAVIPSLSPVLLCMLESPISCNFLYTLQLHIHNARAYVYTSAYVHIYMHAWVYHTSAHVMKPRRGFSTSVLFIITKTCDKMADLTAISKKCSNYLTKHL